LKNIVQFSFDLLYSSSARHYLTLRARSLKELQFLVDTTGYSANETIRVPSCRVNKKPDNLANVVDPIDGGCIDGSGVIYRLKFEGRDVIQKTMRVASRVHVNPYHLMPIVQTEGLREGSAGKIEYRYHPTVQEEPVVDAGTIDVKPGNVSRVVYASRLGAGI
jgi:hypothetical protein